MGIKTANKYDIIPKTSIPIIKRLPNERSETKRPNHPTPPLKK